MGNHIVACNGSCLRSDFSSKIISHLYSCSNNCSFLAQRSRQKTENRQGKDGKANCTWKREVSAFIWHHSSYRGNKIKLHLLSEENIHRYSTLLSCSLGRVGEELFLHRDKLFDKLVQQAAMFHFKILFSKPRFRYSIDAVLKHTLDWTLFDWLYWTLEQDFWYRFQNLAVEKLKKNKK